MLLGVISTMSLRLVLRFAVVLLVIAGLIPVSFADEQPSYRFDLPEQPLADALRAIARQTGANVLFESSDLDGIRVAQLKGQLTASEAIERLLAGTRLRARRTTPSTVIVQPAPASSSGSTRSFRDAAGEGRAIRLAQVDATPAASPTPDDGDFSGIQEITVTARKQSERLQDVPISVTAISAAALQRSGARALGDIARSVPGLNVNSVAPGQNQLIIRGVSSSGGVNTVGYYVDDTPIQSVGNLAGNGMDPALFDLERVEVLRGPQGTLYGASSMGGAVRYITRQPNLERSEGSIQATLGNTRRGGMNYEVSGLLNEPLRDGLAALRAVAFYRDQDGYIDRVPIDPNDYLAALPGPKSDDVNTEETYRVRLSMRIQPTEALSITPSVFLQRTDLGAPFTFDDHPGSFDSPIQTRLVDEPTSDRLQLFSLLIDTTIRGVRLTSSTSYRDRTFDATEDDSKAVYYFLSPVPQSYVYPSAFDNYFANHDFTEEVRAAFDFGRAHALLGIFYSRQSNLRSYHWPVTQGYNDAFGTPFGDEPYFFSGDDRLLARQRAAFGEVNVDLTQRLQATAGLRAFEVKQSLHAPYTGVFNGGSTEVRGSSKDSGVNPKLGLRLRWSPQALAYVTAAKGFRQGGPLADIPVICEGDLAALGFSSPPTSYKSDSLWNYEVGAKTSWLDRRLTINGSAYYMKWSEVQQLVQLPGCGFVFTGNFGKASSKGSELEIAYEPVSSLQLRAGVAYNSAKLLATVPGAQGQAGDVLQNAPKWIGSASMEYHRALGQQTEGYVRFDFSTISGQFNNFNDTSIFHRRAGYSLGNLRIGVERDSWEVALFANNVFDKAAETALPFAFGIDLPTTRRISLNRPRTAGLELRYQF